MDKKDPRIPEFDEVKNKVHSSAEAERVNLTRAKKPARLPRINNPGEIKAAGEKAGFEVATEDDFKLGTPLGQACASPTLDEAIYALREGDVTRRPVKVGDNWVVVGATKRTDADLATFNTRARLAFCTSD